MLKNCMGFILVFVMILPDIVGGDDCEAESWVYASVLDITSGTPLLNLSIGKFALGLSKPLNRLGVGITSFEAFGPPPYLLGYNSHYWQHSYFSASIYSIIYENYNKFGCAQSITYASASANFWISKIPYLSINLGVSYYFAEFQIGLIAIQRGGIYPRLGVKLSLGGWFGTNVKLRVNEEKGKQNE